MSKSSNAIIGLFGILACVFLFGIAGCTLTQQTSTEDIGVPPGQKSNLSSDAGANADKDKPRAADFTMTDGDGNSVKLSDLIANTKPIVLNFWASWCSSCKAEMPDFNKVYQELSNDIQFAMVNLTDERSETKEKGAKYVKDQGYVFPVYFDTRQEGSLVYGIRAIPLTLFIDKDGYIINTIQGTMDEKALRQNIDLIK